MKKEKNDFPLRTAAKEIKISFVLTAVVDLILGVILLFAPEHVTDVLVMLISAGITIYGVFNILSFIFAYKCAPETRGKSLELIQMEFKYGDASGVKPEDE